MYVFWHKNVFVKFEFDFQNKTSKLNVHLVTFRVKLTDKFKNLQNTFFDVFSKRTIKKLKVMTQKHGQK